MANVMTVASTASTFTGQTRRRKNSPSQIGRNADWTRRDLLLEIEKDVQELWEKEGAYQTDAPFEGKPEKYFVTFPFPYMNGKLHLGHAFSITKAEFAARFARLNGKRVLFPFGFHCTGMPIAAAALKLQESIKQRAGGQPQCT